MITITKPYFDTAIISSLHLFRIYVLIIKYLSVILLLLPTGCSKWFKYVIVPYIYTTYPLQIFFGQNNSHILYVSLHITY